MDFIQRVQAGDRDAFEDLFRDYANLVFKAACLILDNPDEAEDALQEVFLKVHHQITTYNPARGTFTVWLYRVTVNHCLNRKRRRGPSMLTLDDADAGALVSGAPSPESQVVIDETMHRALAQLSGRLRTTVILRYYAGLSYAEIAEVLGVPLGTVKSRLNQALKTLRHALAQSEEWALEAEAFQRGEVS